MSWAKEVLNSGRYRIVNRRTGEFYLLNQHRRKAAGSIGGVRRGQGLGISFTPEMAPELARELRNLPLKVQNQFQRRAMRQALNAWKKLALPLYRRHRTRLPRKHLDQSLAIVTRQYKRRKGNVLWGALGFRTGSVRSIGGVVPKADAIYSNEWAGWRAHFLERGFTATGGMTAREGSRVKTKGELGWFNAKMQRLVIKARVAGGEGKRIPGRFYLPTVLSAGKHVAISVFQHSLRQLLRTGGKRIGRIPKSLYSAEMKGLLR